MTPNQSPSSKLVDQALALLGEHFDSAQIFVTSKDLGNGEGTVHISKGTGNWYTRYGQVVSWLKREDAADIDEMRKASEQ